MAEDKPQRSTSPSCRTTGRACRASYSNFCAIQNSPFDFTLTFCDMQPPSERELREAQTTHVVKAPVRARMAIPVQMVPGLITALQDNFRLYQQSFNPPPRPR